MFIPIEFQKAFQKTEQKAIAVTATYSEEVKPLASRFGGLPYWQDDTKIPCDDKGVPLALLAQINFSELPAHDELPTSGILQFFTPRNDDYYGANLDELGGKNQLVTKFWSSPSVDKMGGWTAGINENDITPVFGSHALSFEEKKDYAGTDTIECAEALNANPFEVLEDIAVNEKEELLFFKAIEEYVDGYGHKVLGYPSFADGDPRENNDFRLLLQIDTDMEEDNDIMWGEDGIGQIFIRNDDLKAQRFERACLYWNC